MVKLIAKSPFGGAAPGQAGTVDWSELTYDALALVAPFRGRLDDVNVLLRKSMGLEFPQPNCDVAGTQGRALWVGGGQALIWGKVPALGGLAAVTDQSDAFAVLAVRGAQAEDVLCRLIPVDLRQSALATGRTARTLIGHMTASVTRTGDTQFELMVMRSMAGTLAHEVERAAKGVAARTGTEA